MGFSGLDGGGPGKRFFRFFRAALQATAHRGEGTR